MGINQRVSLRKFTDDIKRWVDEGRGDDWIASALGTSPSSVQSFRSRNAIYRREHGSALYEPKDYTAFEGALEKEKPGVWFDPSVGDNPHWKSYWDDAGKVEMRVTPSKIILIRRGKAR